MRLPKVLVLSLAGVALVAAGCSSGSSTTEASTNSSAPAEACSFDKTVKGVTAVQQAGSPPELIIADDAEPPKKLEVIDLCEGVGETATNEYAVLVDYVGAGYDSGKVFDSSFTSGQPSAFALTPGAGLIDGWVDGIPGMTPGGARLLLIPSDMAYGKAGRAPSIGPNEALAFIVELRDLAPLSEIQGNTAPSPS